jgi:hypothetical protein
VIAVDKGVPQTKNVMFVVRVALVIELKNFSQQKMKGAVIKDKLIPGW